MLDVARSGAHRGGKRRLASKTRGECIDRHNGKARRMRDELPSESQVLPKHAVGQSARALFVRRSHRLVGQRVAQGLDDALPHFTGGFARESHCQDPLRAIDRREQSQEALNQEFGLAGAGGSLDEE